MAKEKGKRLGKPPIQYPDNWKDVYTIWKSGSITAHEAMKRLNLKPTSFYKLAKNYNYVLYIKNFSAKIDVVC